MERRETDKEPLEQIPTARTGDRVLRRRRKPKGILRTISGGILRLFRSRAAR